MLPVSGAPQLNTSGAQGDLHVQGGKYGGLGLVWGLVRESSQPLRNIHTPKETQWSLCAMICFPYFFFSRPPSVYERRKVWPLFAVI